MSDAEDGVPPRRPLRTVSPLHVTADIEYALRALVALALEGPMTAGDIAARHGLSHPFLQQVLRRLRNAELVSSRRGASGGYRLRRAPESIRVIDILQSLSHDIGTIGPPLPGWDQVDELWRTLDDTIYLALSRTSVADLATGVIQPTLE